MVRYFDPTRPRHSIKFRPELILTVQIENSELLRTLKAFLVSFCSSFSGLFFYSCNLVTCQFCSCCGSNSRVCLFYFLQRAAKK